MTKRPVRAICLLSGGLDSILAVKVLKEQGIEVTGLTFVSPFFSARNGERAAAQLQIPLIVHDISREVMDLVRHPPHGYGKGLNPCIDCHALMVRKAAEILRLQGFDLIATGEVLGERPMSQNRQSLDTVARDSGAAEFLLRPLSAKLLPATQLELCGLVDREQLLSIEGRSRKPQMELAARYGITEYVQPAGGCLLTDPAFAVRLRELMRAKPSWGIDDANLLKLGRHFRFPSGAKLVVGRDERDNAAIAAAVREGDALIVSDITPGPTCLLTSPHDVSDIELAAGICASFADNEGHDVELELRLGGEQRRITAHPSPRRSFDAMRI